MIEPEVAIVPSLHGAYTCGWMNEGRNECLVGEYGECEKIPSQCSVGRAMAGVRVGGARSRGKKPSQPGEGFVEEVAWGGSKVQDTSFRQK